MLYKKIDANELSEDERFTYIDKLAMHCSITLLMQIIDGIKSIEKPMTRLNGSIDYMNGTVREQKMSDGFIKTVLISDATQIYNNSSYGDTLSLSSLIVHAIKSKKNDRLFEKFLSLLEDANNSIFKDDLTVKLHKAKEAKKLFISSMNN